MAIHGNQWLTMDILSRKETVHIASLFGVFYPFASAELKPRSILTTFGSNMFKSIFDSSFSLQKILPGESLAGPVMFASLLLGCLPAG